jgi:hypothetical protein
MVCVDSNTPPARGSPFLATTAIFGVMGYFTTPPTVIFDSDTIGPRVKLILNLSDWFRESRPHFRLSEFLPPTDGERGR